MVRASGIARRWLVPAACAVAAVLAGCKNKSAMPPLERVRRPAPLIEDVRASVNGRAEKLQRVWARAVTSIAWTQPDGTRRSEQGEGFFQLIQPSRLALDIGKVGEVVIWAGCDASRYWVIRRGDEKTAIVGRHDGPGSDRLLEEGLPATPMDMIELAGVTPLAASELPPTLGWTADGFWVVEERRPYGTLMREIEPGTGEPRRLVMKSGGKACVESVLVNPAPVERANTSEWARMPTRITVSDLLTGSTIVVGLEGMSDGIRGRRPGNERMQPVVFDFEALCEKLGVQRVEDLDASAVPAGIPGERLQSGGGRVSP